MDILKYGIPKTFPMKFPKALTRLHVVMDSTKPILLELIQNSVICRGVTIKCTVQSKVVREKHSAPYANEFNLYRLGDVLNSRCKRLITGDSPAPMKQ